MIRPRPCTVHGDMTGALDAIRLCTAKASLWSCALHLEVIESHHDAVGKCAPRRVHFLPRAVVAEPALWIVVYGVPSPVIAKARIEVERRLVRGRAARDLQQHLVEPTRRGPRKCPKKPM